MKIVRRFAFVVGAATALASCESMATITAPPEALQSIAPSASVSVRAAPACTTLTSSFLQGSSVCAKFDFTVLEEGGETNAWVEWLNPSNVVQAAGTYTETYLDGDGGVKTLDRTFNLAGTAPTGIWTVRLCETSCDISSGGILRASAPFTVLAAQTITFPDPADQTYGDADFPLGATASSGLAVSYTSQTPSVCTVSGSTVSIEAAGTCTITASQAGNTTNWAPASDVEQSIAISPRPITVTADAKEKFEGESDPPLTYQVTSGSLVGLDDFTGGLSRDPGSTVGVYAILQNTLSAGPNYDLDYVGANLTIQPAPSTSDVTLTGFFNPVHMGEVTTSNAGSMIPLGFRIYVDDVQKKTTDGITFELVSVNCETFEEIDEVEIDVSTLRYAGGNNGGAFLLNWKTPDQAGCYKLTMSYEGASLTAIFNLW